MMFNMARFKQLPGQPDNTFTPTHTPVVIPEYPLAQLPPQLPLAQLPPQLPLGPSSPTPGGGSPQLPTASGSLGAPVARVRNPFTLGGSVPPQYQGQTLVAQALRDASASGGQNG